MQRTMKLYRLPEASGAPGPRAGRGSGQGEPGPQKGREGSRALSGGGDTKLAPPMFSRFLDFLLPLLLLLLLLLIRAFSLTVFVPLRLQLG